MRLTAYQKLIQLLPTKDGLPNTLPKAVLALVHMTRSGPTYDIEGPGLGVSEWSQALTLLDEVINSKKYSFLASYPTIFSLYQ